MTIESTYLTGHFLIAMPNLKDPNFYQALLYICEHSEQGAMGIIVNRPLNVGLGEILHHINIKTNNSKALQQQIYQGGPIQQDRGFVLHTPVEHWKSTLKVTEDIAITTSQDILSAVAEGDGPSEMLIALGYAGWAPGQLEQEIGNNAWLSEPAELDIIFSTPYEQRWKKAAENLGFDINLISDSVGHA